MQPNVFLKTSENWSNTLRILALSSGLSDWSIAPSISSESVLSSIQEQLGNSGFFWAVLPLLLAGDSERTLNSANFLPESSSTSSSDVLAIRTGTVLELPMRQHKQHVPPTYPFPDQLVGISCPAGPQLEQTTLPSTIISEWAV